MRVRRVADIASGVGRDVRRVNRAPRAKHHGDWVRRQRPGAPLAEALASSPGRTGPAGNLGRADAHGLLGLRALAPTREAALPHVFALGHGQQSAQLAAVQDVGQRLALLGRAQYRGRIALEVLILHAERKKPFSAATARAWLDGAGRRVASSARKRRRSGARTSTSAVIESACRNVRQARTSRS